VHRGSRALLLVPALTLVLAGCGGSDSGDDSTITQPTTGATSGAPAAGGTALSIKGFAFNPNPLTVAPGATIDVTNSDSATHDVTADLFKSGDVDKGKPASFKAPTTPGTYSYICSYHGNMKGSLVVK
jgi:plastocyanin